MERLMVVTTFQKSIDSLKTTECSQKEKLALFTQISDCIQSAALRGNANYLNFVSNAVSILLMFCEDIDSVVRMSSEENLNRIIRFSTPANVVRIQYDLFQEIKRNGNDRSLRIALNLFSHYAHMIKQRKVKPYALNLLPCILSISQRKEPQLIETLSNFLGNFCKFFQISLNESEVYNLIEFFLKNAISTECSVKRRCSATNVMTLIEHARRPEVMSKHALTLCLDELVKDFTSNTIIGGLGLLRVLLPKFMSINSLDASVTHKVVEIYEICLHLLGDKNHTIINASLECLCVILTNSKPQLTNLLISDKLIHMEILCKKRTIKNLIFRRKLSASSMEVPTLKNQTATPRKHMKTTKMEIDTQATKELENSESEASNVVNYALTHNLACDDKGLLTGSDVELNDFELCQSNESLVKLTDKTSPTICKSLDTHSLKSHKSTDSLSSIFNTLMHPNTETVTKFFRVGGASSQPSESQTPNLIENSEDELNQTELSDASLNSSALSTFDLLNKTDDSIPEIEILNAHEIATIRLESDQIDGEKTEKLDQTIEPFTNVNFDAVERDIVIGTIGNQPLVYYTVRLIASKFLLYGIPYKLIDDCEVRVSIKNLSLAIIGHCVALCPRTLLLSLQYNGPENLAFENQSDSEESVCSDTGSPSKTTTKTGIEPAADQLNIKDDHFGENSQSRVPNTYFDFFFPLSKSADNVLLSRLNSESTGNDQFKRSQKLNGDLSDLLSKSDIVESKSSYKCLDIALDSSLPTNDKSLSSQELIQPTVSGSLQFVEDILLYWKHSDPILRANVQLFVGNFLNDVLNECDSISNFIERLEIASTYRFLNFNVLFHILIQGLSDDIHTVVKQSLISLEKILTVLLDFRPKWFYKNEVFMQPIASDVDRLPSECSQILSPIQLFDEILTKLSLVYENKYWVVQNKYCRFVATINYDAVDEIIGRDKGQVYKNCFISHIYGMLKDSDVRIRSEAANAILDFNTLQAQRLNKQTNMCVKSSTILAELVAETLLNEVPFSIDSSAGCSDGFHRAFDLSNSDSQQMGTILGKHLFDITNILFDLKSNEQLLGVVKCLFNTLNAFSPIQFIAIWSEYNIIDICMELLLSNYTTGTDLSCQCELLTISVNLLAASILRQRNHQNDRKHVTTLVGHVMKIFSIYHNVLINKRPVFIPKGQKPDLFVNSRELQLINSYGYFGNDYFYLKIYKTIRIIHENYKITISEEIDSKLFSLLKIGLRTMSLLLEIMEPFTSTESTIFFDEILVYIKTFLIYEPSMSVVCIKQLIRNMFAMNYPNWKTTENLFDFERMKQMTPSQAFEYLDEVRCHTPAPQKPNVDITPVHTGSKLINFLASTSTPEKHKTTNEQRNIKLFEPLVIQCLKIFSKSDSELQSYVLDMLCQVLQLKVSYCLLDAKNLFMDFILKLIESIEIGIVRNSHMLTPKIIKFLFYLAKQKEKPQMSIPKIINITDNLLANSITKNGSIEALFQLAFEVYFPRCIETDLNDSQQNRKELNTQKEVVFSMLLKFIDCFEVKRMICLILLKETNASKEIHTEMAECLLQIIGDQKPFVANSNDYYLLHEMCMQIRKLLVSDRSSISKLLTRFEKPNERLFDDVATKSIILECIFESSNEDSILRSVSHVTEPGVVEHFAENIRNDLITNFSYTEFEYAAIFDGDAMKTMEYIELLGNYLASFSKMLANCVRIAQPLREYFKNNTKFIETVFEFIKNFSAISSSTKFSQKTNWDGVKSFFTAKLCTLLFDLYEAPVFVEVMKRMKYEQNISAYYDRCIISNVMKSLLLQPLDRISIEYLLENCFTDILFNDSDFIRNGAKDDAVFNLILIKLGDLIRGNILQSNVTFLYLDIIEAADDRLTMLCVKHLLQTESIYQYGSATSRRSFIILRNKLNKLSDDTNAQLELVSSIKQFKSKFEYHEMFGLIALSIENILAVNNEEICSFDEMSVDIVINDDWFYKKAGDVMKSKINRRRIFQILSEVKSEQKLHQIFETTRDEFDMNLLSTLIECSFENMTKKFKHDCFQHNAHMNYLKLSPVLKESMNIMSSKLDEICLNYDQNNEKPFDGGYIGVDRSTFELKAVMASMSVFLRCIAMLQKQCMIYIEVSFINKFFVEHFFKAINFQRLVQFAFVCLHFIERTHSMTNNTNMDDVTIAGATLSQIIRAQSIFDESANFFATDESYTFFHKIVVVLYDVVHTNLSSKSFLEKYQLNKILNESNQMDSELSYAKAIFLAVFVEHSFDKATTNRKCDNLENGNHLTSFRESMLSLIIDTLRSDSFYFFAVTPHEIIKSFEWQPNPASTNSTITFQSVPIECLNEIEIVEKFLQRINIFGFSSRQHFEEFFMSLLLLINKENNVNIVDAQEEYQIKNMCLLALLELLISCKMYPIIGDRLGSLFYHVPRLQRLTADSISSRKLHEIQSELHDQSSVFYMPNLERCNYRANNIIGTDEFLMHQFDLKVLWHIIEEQPPVSRNIKVELKNMKYFLENAGVDFNSSIQLMFDVITQLHETNSIQTLPHIVKFSELCENRDQFHWIKDTMSKLHETVPMENAIAHQNIIYCLCKSYAIAIPSLHDINHLCTILGNYLKSAHLFIRVATLRGLLLLFESCIKTNTTIGGLNEEIQLLHTFISNYITRYGIIEESTLSFSTEHTVLVWTLNFYVIETTSKFIPECNLIGNTIVSAINILKRTTSLTLFSCIIHGLERVIISKTIAKYFHEKVEKLALDLVKLENENFSLLALKLLVTCMYVGSNEQLENTEKCNGIVQDEPEVIMHTTEKIETCFQRIKLATRPAAHIYGNVLCQLINDLVPPKELLTKVIKEFLTVSQPHCEVVARVLFQVFRSAIDSAYLPLLQDWLLCSLPNFVTFPIQKIMWYLIVIFMSASINLSLIKIFPQVLADYSAVFNNLARDKFDHRPISSSSLLQYKHLDCDSVTTRQRFLFKLACKDFYDRLNNEQKHKFRDIFSNLKEPEVYDMLKAL